MGFILAIKPELSVFTALAAICATLWTYCYVECIRTGLREKTCAMPIEALAFNFAWEILFGIVWFSMQPGQNLQSYVNIVWGAFDIGIIYTFFKYGHTRGVSDVGFRWFGAACILFAFGIMGSAMWLEYPDVDRLHALTAWLVNAVMSVMFLRLLWSRGPAGQNMRIAWTKALGTFAVTLAFTLPSAPNVLGPMQFPIIVTTGWLCFAFDLTYIYLLRKALNQAGSYHCQTCGEELPAHE